jgi:transcriptional regulator with XRE-family HTH domain
MVHDTALRRARLARGLTVDDVAARTRISARFVVLLDEGRYHELPAGLYARAYVRAFAAATGVDPDAAVARLEPLLPAVADPVGALRESFRGAPDEPPLSADLGRIWNTLRTRAEASLAGPAARDPLPDLVARSAGAVADTLVLTVVNAVLLTIAAVFCDVGLAELLQHAGGASAVFCALTAMLYYVILAGIGGRTPGSRLWQGPPAAEGPVRPAVILKRAGRAWLSGSSIILDVLFNADRSSVRSIVSRLDHALDRVRAA